MTALDGTRDDPLAGVTPSDGREAAADEGELVEDFFFFFRDVFEDVRAMVAMMKVVALVVGTSGIRCRTIVAVVGTKPWFYETYTRCNIIV